MPGTGHPWEVRKLLLAPEMRTAISKQVLADQVEPVAERTGTDPVQDMHARLWVAA